MMGIPRLADDCRERPAGRPEKQAGQRDTGQQIGRVATRIVEGQSAEASAGARGLRR